MEAGEFTQLVDILKFFAENWGLIGAGFGFVLLLTGVAFFQSIVFSRKTYTMIDYYLKPLIDRLDIAIPSKLFYEECIDSFLGYLKDIDTFRLYLGAIYAHVVLDLVRKSTQVDESLSIQLKSYAQRVFALLIFYKYPSLDYIDKHLEEVVERELSELRSYGLTHFSDFSETGVKAALQEVALMLKEGLGTSANRVANPVKKRRGC